MRIGRYKKPLNTFFFLTSFYIWQKIAKNAFLIAHQKFIIDTQHFVFSFFCIIKEEGKKYSNMKLPSVYFVPYYTLDRIFEN